VADLLVVGSVALDSVETPFGKVQEVLGGSATFFSYSASFFTPVHLVATVGEDFPEEHLKLLRDRGVNVRGLQVAAGRTFRWTGVYGYDLNEAKTLDTQLNVFADFHPRLPAQYRRAEYLFLGNIHPALQLDVLSQIERPKFVALDTMNFWIEGERAALTRVIERVDAVLINEAEARQYARTHNLLRAARELMALGPSVVVIKKGEYGSVLFARDCHFIAPGYPLETVKDPTGAGDSFAGAFVGYLARAGDLEDATLRRAVVHGSAVASFTCEDFSVGRLKSLDAAAVRQRCGEFRRFTHFDHESE
jgi:sugar/nucleoside kinase (ribokinase family)